MANESLYGSIVSIVPKDYRAFNEDLLPPERILDIEITQSLDGRYIYLRWKAPIVNAPSDPYLDDRYPEPEFPFRSNEPTNVGTEDYPIHEYPIMYGDPLPLRDLGGFRIYKTTMQPEAWMGQPGNLNNLMNSFQNTKPDGYGNSISNSRVDPYHPPLFDIVGVITTEDTETDEDGFYVWRDELVFLNQKYYYTVTAFDKETGLKEYSSVGTKPLTVDARVFRWPYR